MVIERGEVTVDRVEYMVLHLGFQIILKLVREGFQSQDIRILRIVLGP